MFEEEVEPGSGWDSLTETIDALAGTAARTYATVNNPTGIGYTYSRTGGSVSMSIGSLLVPLAIIIAVVVLAKK